MKRKTVIFLTLAALIGGGLWLARDKISPPPAPQATVEITRGSIESVVTAQGKLEAKDYVDVGAQVSGLVIKLLVDVGDSVKEGDLIAEIDPDVYEAQVKGEEARLRTLQAQRDEQQALMVQAEQKLARNQKLMKTKAISIEVLEDAQTNYDVAVAKLKSLDAQLEEAQSSLDASRTNLSYTKIYSPMTGTVVSQSVKQGQTINANQTAPVIVQVAKLDVMTAKAQVAEADVPKLSVGMPVYFTTLGAGERKWEGSVRQVLPTPETINDVVLYNVLVDVANTDGQLMTGMTAQIFFIAARADDAAIIPVSALTKRKPDADTKDGKAYEISIATPKGPQERTVIVGVSDRTQAAVVSGLEGGERVIVATPAASADKPASGAAPRRMGMGRL